MRSDGACLLWKPVSVDQWLSPVMRCFYHEDCLHDSRENPKHCNAYLNDFHDRLSYTVFDTSE